MTAVTSNNTHTVRQLWVSYCNTGRRCEIVSHLFWQSLVGQSCLWRCATTGAEIKAYLHWSLRRRWSASRSQAPLPWVHLPPVILRTTHAHRLDIAMSSTWDQYYTLHTSPLFPFTTPHGEHSSLSPPVTCGVDNSSWWWFWMWEDFPAGFLIPNSCNWVNMPYCLKIDVFMFTGTVWSCILSCLRSFIGRCGFLLHP